MRISHSTNLNIRHWRYVSPQTRKHGDQCQHARHEQSDPPWNGIQIQPEAEPGQHHDQGRGSEGLDQVMPDLTLESEVDY